MGKHTNNNDLFPGTDEADLSRDRELEDILAEYDLLAEDGPGEDAAVDLAAILGDAVSGESAAVEPEEEALPADFFETADTAILLEQDAVPTAAAVTAPEAAPERPARPSSAPAKKKAPSGAVRKTAASKKKRSSAKSSKKRRRKKKDHFRTGLVVYLLILLAIIIALLVTLWIGLDRSQKRIDAENAELERQRQELAEEQAHATALYRAPQLAFESWLAGTNADYWTELWYADRSEDLDGRERVRAYLSERFDPAAVEPFKSLDYTDAAPVYVLKNGEDTLARVTLSGSDLDWSVSDVALLVEGSYSASVRVASGSRVYCNGVALGDDYISDSSSYFTYEPLRDTLVNPVTWNTYTVSGLLMEPTLTADPPEGGIVTETSEGDFLLCLDAAAGAAYQTRSVNFVKAYLYYYMSGGNGTWGNLYAALNYLTPGYQAYRDLQDTYNGVYWNTAYSNIDTSKTTAGDVVIWADNCYSVDVTYDADCTLNGQHIDYVDATMRIYFLNTNAGWIISNFESL